MATEERGGRRARLARRRVLPPLALFLLAPYLGEYVLGNQPVAALPQLLLLAPMYGAGALVIREVGRRTRSGWPVMVLLAAAYALVEEGLVDQLIFNPAYLGLGTFEDHAPVPGVGISASLTLDSLALHAIGSTCVPIALVEAFQREEARPWLRPAGLGAVAAVFVLGSTALAVMQAVELDFVGTPLQFTATASVVCLLCLGALRQAPREAAGPTDPPARSPRVVGTAAFVATTAYWLTGGLVSSVASGWLAVAGGAVVLAVGAALLHRESRRRGWGRRHRVAVATGALATYLWLAFVNTRLLGVPLVSGVVGNVVFGASAVVLMVAATRATRALAGPVDQASPEAGRLA